MKTTVFMAVAALLLTSCSVLHVSKGDGDANTECKGIPFYVQKEVYKQETKYLYTWIEVSLSAVNGKEGDKPASSSTWRLRPNVGIIRYLNEVTSNPELTEADLIEFRAKIDTAAKASLYPDSSLVDQVVSNSCKPELVVDYTTKYYLNARKPIFGNTTVTQKLAANGTLAESSATVESSLDEIAIAAIGLATPFASVKVAQITAAATALSGLEKGKQSNFPKTQIAEPVKTQYTISIREAGYVYTFTKYHDTVETCNSKPIKPSFNTVNFIRTAYNAQESVSKDNKKAIKVEGSIELPEDK